jgi:hypothetical protein
LPCCLSSRRDEISNASARNSPIWIGFEGPCGKPLMDRVEFDEQFMRACVRYAMTRRRASLRHLANSELTQVRACAIAALEHRGELGVMSHWLRHP